MMFPAKTSSTHWFWSRANTTCYSNRSQRHFGKRWIYFLPPIILITQKIAAIRLLLFKNSRKIRCFCLAQFILAMMSSTCSGRSIRMQAKHFLMRKTCAVVGTIMALVPLALRYQINSKRSPNTLAIFSHAHLGNGICFNI